MCVCVCVCMYIYKEKKKEEGNKKEKEKRKRRELDKIREMHTHELGLMVSTLLFIKIKNPLLHGGFIIRILKNILKSLRG